MATKKVTKKALVKKAVVKRIPPKKAVVKKAAARKVVVKKTPAKKVVVKKAAPVKKVEKKKVFAIVKTTAVPSKVVNRPAVKAKAQGLQLKTKIQTAEGWKRSIRKQGKKRTF